MNSNNGHYARAAGDGEGIPLPSPHNQEVILDAWREALGEVLALRDREWKEKMRLMQAECMAVVAEFRAAAAEFRSSMEAMVAERLGQLRQPADGREGPRGDPGPPGSAGKLNGVRA